MHLYLSRRVSIQRYFKLLSFSSFSKIILFSLVLLEIKFSVFLISESSKMSDLSSNHPQVNIALSHCSTATWPFFTSPFYFIMYCTLYCTKKSELGHKPGFMGTELVSADILRAPVKNGLNWSRNSAHGMLKMEIFWAFSSLMRRTISLKKVNSYLL